jgi:hypothetical protein
MQLPFVSTNSGSYAMQLDADAAQPTDCYNFRLLIWHGILSRGDDPSYSS